MIVKPEDFVGELDLGSNCYTDETLEVLIDQWEPIGLDLIIGCELRVNLINDLDTLGNPQSQRWIDLFSPFTFEHGCETLCFEGIPYMLRRYIFWRFFKRRRQKATISGIRETKSENSKPSESFGVFIAGMYNVFAKQGEVLQKYMHDNENVYPEFKYKCIPKASVF